jgi:hypothetical protein
MFNHPESSFHEICQTRRFDGERVFLNSTTAIRCSLQQDGGLPRRRACDLPVEPLVVTSSAQMVKWGAAATSGICAQRRRWRAAAALSSRARDAPPGVVATESETGRWWSFLHPAVPRWPRARVELHARPMASICADSGGAWRTLPKQETCGSGVAEVRPLLSSGARLQPAAAIVASSTCSGQ